MCTNASRPARTGAITPCPPLGSTPSARPRVTEVIEVIEVDPPPAGPRP
jgi:hypothetical protein